MKQSAMYYLSPTRSKALVDSQRARAQYRNHYACQVREVVSARRLLTLVDEGPIDRAATLATYLRYIRPALRDADPNGWEWRQYRASGRELDRLLAELGIDNKRAPNPLERHQAQLAAAQRKQVRSRRPLARRDPLHKCSFA